jgi:hypothetical protein
MSELVSSGFADFDRLALLYRRTRELLDEVSVTGEVPSSGSRMLATETLPHVEDMEAGFQIWLRAPEARKEELRLLVARSGMVPPTSLDPAEERAALIEAIQKLTGAGGERELVPPAQRRIAAINLARLTFALLPMTPSDDVHYRPGCGRMPILRRRAPRQNWPTGSRSWSAACGTSPPAPAAADRRSYRRTYGFFDAATRLSGGGFLLS